MEHARGLAVRVIYKAAVALTAVAIGASAFAADQEIGTTSPAAAAAERALAPSDPTTSTAPRPTTTQPTTTTALAPQPRITPLPPPPPPPPPPTTTKPKPPAPKPSVGTPCNSTARACVDLSANLSWLLQGGQVIYGPVPITHGRPGWPTPAGTFRVQWKDIDHKSSLFDDAPMPYSVFFNGGIAFHAGSLTVQSHGCIHLSTTAARTYYNTLQVGNIVQVVP